MLVIQLPPLYNECTSKTTPHVEAKTRFRKSASLSAVLCSNNMLGQLINCKDIAASISGDSRGKYCSTVLKSLLSPLLKDPDAWSHGRTTISRAKKWAWSTKRGSLGSLLIPLKCSKFSGDMSTMRFHSSV